MDIFLLIHFTNYLEKIWLLIANIYIKNHNQNIFLEQRSKINFFPLQVEKNYVIMFWIFQSSKFLFMLNQVLMLKKINRTSEIILSALSLL